MDSRAPNLDVLLAEASWVRALAHSLVRDPAAADDVVQETWLAALRRPPDTTRPVRPWLARVVENFARMRVRGESGRERREESAARPESLASTEELCARVETQRLLAQEVLALSEPFRSTIVLRYYEGLSAAEIARRVGAPSATVRWRLMRGLEYLRERLDERHGGDRDAWGALLLPLAAGAANKTALKSAAGVGVVVARVVMLLAMLLGLGWLWRSTARRDEGNASAAKPSALSFEPPNSPGNQADSRTAVRAESPSRDGSVMRASGARVAARIVDDELHPLAGARLVVLSTGASAEAGADGSVELQVARERRELLAFEARADGHVAARVDAHLARDGDTYLGDIVVARAGALKGVVGDDLGRPIAGARVRAEIIGSRWKGVSAPPLEEARYVETLQGDAPLATTGADGRFRFDALPRSFVRVWASADGFVTDWSDDISIAVARTTQAPRFALRPPPPEQRLAGVAIDPSGAPVGNAELECARISLQNAFFRGERGVIRARADERGRFDFGVDPQSHYDLAARDAAGSFAPSIVEKLSPGSRDLVVALAPLRHLAISARDESGAAIDELRVEFTAVAGSKALQLESEQFVAGVGPMPYVAFNLRIGARNFAAVNLGPFDPQSAPSQLEIVLKRATQFTGTVRGLDGGALEGASVELVPALPEQRTRAAVGSVASGEPFALLCDELKPDLATLSDHDGRFALDVPSAGSYFARVAAPMCATAFVGPLQLDPALNIEQTIALSSGGAIEGAVVRSDGGDVAGTIVGVSCGDAMLATTRVGPDGRFRFDHLAPRAWQVRAVAREVDGDWAPLPFERRAAASRPPTWDGQVREGAVTRCDVLIEPIACVLRVDLLFDGGLVGAWRAEATCPSERKRAPSECTLDPDGRFELPLPHPGEWTVKLARITRTEAAIEISKTLVLPPGVHDPGLIIGSLTVATLEVSSDVRSSATEQFVVRASSSWPGLSIEAVARVDEQGHASITGWPGRKTTLKLDTESEPGLPRAPAVEIDVLPGEKRLIELHRD